MRCSSRSLSCRSLWVALIVIAQSNLIFDIFDICKLTVDIFDWRYCNQVFKPITLSGSDCNCTIKPDVKTAMPLFDKMGADSIVGIKQPLCLTLSYVWLWILCTNLQQHHILIRAGRIHCWPNLFPLHKKPCQKICVNKLLLQTAGRACKISFLSPWIAVSHVSHVSNSHTITVAQFENTLYCFVSSDRSSYSDDGLVYIRRPLFEILSIQAFL